MRLAACLANRFGAGANEREPMSPHSQFAIYEVMLLVALGFSLLWIVAGRLHTRAIAQEDCTGIR